VIPGYLLKTYWLPEAVAIAGHVLVMAAVIRARSRQGDLAGARLYRKGIVCVVAGSILVTLGAVFLRAAVEQNAPVVRLIDWVPDWVLRIISYLICFAPLVGAALGFICAFVVHRLQQRSAPPAPRET
jgi:hypothetical protein